MAGAAGGGDGDEEIGGGGAAAAEAAALPKASSQGRLRLYLHMAVLAVLKTPPTNPPLVVPCAHRLQEMLNSLWDSPGGASPEKAELEKGNTGLQHMAVRGRHLSMPVWHLSSRRGGGARAVERE